MGSDIWTERKWSESKPPSWQCPRCRKGVLRLETDTLKFAETAQSPFTPDGENSGPECYEARFVCMFYCSDRSCQDPSSVVGTVYLNQISFDERGEGPWEKVFTPTYFEPPPQPIVLPEVLPPKVADELWKAFALYWNSSPACATSVRRAIEFLLDHERVLQDEDGSGSRANLHTRLEQYAKSKPEIADQLTTLKLVGNAGAHSSNVAHEDLLKAFEILERVLEELFDQRATRIQDHSDHLRSRYQR